MNPTQARLPAEWEPQAAVLIAWPHAGTDWAPRLAEVERTYVALVCAITRFQSVVICVAHAQLREHAQRMLEAVDADARRVAFVEIPYDDTWLRDSGPITLRDGDAFRLLDFRFTGWGGKFDAEQDDKLIDGLVHAGLFRHARHERVDWALEGGAIESDGRGAILTTWQCLHQRHPDLERARIEATLLRHLAGERVLWLDHGHLQGDDTDAHIDTLARFAPDDAIVFQHCDDRDDSHHPELERMRQELEALRTSSGAPYRLHALPWAQPILDGERRLAASYANYLIINGAVLMPAYDDPADDAAARVLANAHPGREVVPISCRSLIWQNGSLHCVTMQLPAGVLAAEDLFGA